MNKGVTGSLGSSGKQLVDVVGELGRGRPQRPHDGDGFLASTPSTCVPWVTSYPPDERRRPFSIGTPTSVATFLIVGSDR